MRTTIDLGPDVLAAARDIARAERTSVGKIISRLLRQALSGGAGKPPAAVRAASVTGFLPIPARGVIVTDELINRLRDAESTEFAAPVALSPGGTPVSQLVLDDRG